MAWIKTWAGKAEDLLNTIDENTANVLGVEEKSFGHAKQPKKVSSLTKLCAVQVQRMEEHKELHTVPCSKAVITDSYGVARALLKLPQGTLSRTSDTTQKHSFLDIVEYHKKMETLERENQVLSAQVLNLQHSLTEIEHENASLQDAVNSALISESLAEEELAEYKARSHRILKEKETLLGRRKDSPDQRRQMIDAVYESIELKAELENLQEKHNKLMERFEVQKFEIKDLKEQLDTVNRHTNVYVELLKQEQKMHETTQEKASSKLREIQTAYEKATQNEFEAKAQLQAAEKLNEELRRVKPSPPNGDVQKRLEALTVALLTKQTTIEKTCAEKNALRFQLEKLQEDHTKLVGKLKTERMNLAKQSGEVTVNISNFWRASPFDVGVTRKVKYAYTSLEVLSVRVVAFLRRYPLIAVFVVFYLLFVHLLMAVFLFTYMPNSS